MGRNDYGQIGDNTIELRSSPVQIGALTDWSQASGGRLHTAVVKTNGTLWAWGRNNYGQLGDGTRVNKSSPVQIGALTTWSEVACGRYHTVSIKTDGTLWAWGRNSNGELGDNTTTPRSSPVQIGNLTNWSKVGCGLDGRFTFSIKTDKTLWDWGYNGVGSGQLGDNTEIDKSSPIQIGSLTWSKVAGGRLFMIALED